MDNIFAGTPLTEEQKKTLRVGQLAKSFKESAHYKFVLDWMELRANASLARIRENQSNDSELCRAFQKNWQRDENLLVALQTHVFNLSDDYDELMQMLMSPEQEFPDHGDIAVGATAPER